MGVVIIRDIFDPGEAVGRSTPSFRVWIDDDRWGRSASIEHTIRSIAISESYNCRVLVKVSEVRIHVGGNVDCCEIYFLW